MEIGKKMVSQLISRFGGVVAVGLALVGYLWIASPLQAESSKAKAPTLEPGQAIATFAGGCFWCLESDMDNLPGVISTTSGYTGGTRDNPNYQNHYKAKPGGSPHFEAVQIVYDTSVLSYDDLLTVFWHSVDVTDDGGQFCDRGDSYRTAVFVTKEQRAAAEASKAEIAAGEWPKKPIVTPIIDVAEFFPAETYHQDYHTKNPIRYRYYRNGCRRDQTVKRVWGPLAYKGLPSH